MDAQPVIALNVVDLLYKDPVQYVVAFVAGFGTEM